MKIVFIEYACGCIVEKEIYGEWLGLVNYKDWARKHYCPKCQIARINAEAMSQAQKNGLPNLMGTEKQIAWATSIRQRILGILDKWIETIKRKENMSNSSEDNTSYLDFYDAKSKLISTETSARFWIDCNEMFARNNSINPRTFLVKYMKQQ